MDIFCDYNYNVLDTKYFIMKLRHKILCHGFGAFAIVKTAILLFWFFAGIHWVWWVSAEWQTIPEWSWFLDSGFWNKYNSNYTYVDDWIGRTNYWTSDLVEALYGTSSVYVQNWTGYTENPCTDTDMKVVETDSLPQSLDGNTIYVLTNDFNAVFWDGNKTSLSVTNRCSAIVSSWMFKIYLSEELNDKNKWVVSVLSSNFILDNVKIEWTGQRVNNWLYIINTSSFTINKVYTYWFTEKSVSSAENPWVYCENSSYWLLSNIKSSLNDRGIKILLSSYLDIVDCDLSYNEKLWLDCVFSNSKFSNSVIHDNQWLWVYLHGWSNNFFDNLQIYWVLWDKDTQSAGFRIVDDTWNNTISNLLIYNINSFWIYIGSDENAFNNIQIFNIFNWGGDEKNWIHVWGNSNILNNIIVYNAKWNWIAIPLNKVNNIFNNVWVYNTKKWISDSNHKPDALNYYCSWLYLFGNTDSSDLSHFLGDCNSFSGGLLSNWSLYVNNNTISWDYITNPLQKTKDRIKSWYMLNWGSGFSDIRWYVSNYTWETIKYSFGIKTPLQVQLLMWSGDDIVASDLPYNSGMYIWATDTVYATWKISYLDSQNINVVTWSNFLTHYSVFGESNAWIFDQPIWQQTGLRWNVNTWNLNWKRLVVQLKERSNDNDKDIYLATHFEEKINIPNCLSTWNNDNFLNENFWKYYSGENDMWRLQLICALFWKDQTDKTAYTIWWSGRDTTQCSGADMKVLYYTGELPHDLDENTIYVLNTGKVINTDTISMARCSAIVSKSGSILYSTTINSGIKLDNKQYSILDNIAVDWSNIANEWIVLYYSNNITLNNVKSYSNKYCGIYLEQSNDNVLNNIQTYNNESNWIDLYQSNNNNVLNNIQSYNNNNWIYILYGSDNNVLNNVRVYNNSLHGIYIISWSKNILNNIWSYNNEYGISLSPLSSENQYYGSLSVFWNGSDNTVPSELTAWWSEDYNNLWRSEWEDSHNWTLSWNLFTNPKNSAWNYLLPWTWNYASLRWAKTPIWEIDEYSYGVEIWAQIQPVVWSNGALIVWWSFDSDKYVGSNVKMLTWYLEYDNMQADWTRTVTWHSDYDNIISQYKIFWDINDTEYTWNHKSMDITYTWDADPKLLVTQLKWDSYFASHFENRATAISCRIILDEESSYCTGWSVKLKVEILSWSVESFKVYLSGSDNEYTSWDIVDGSWIVSVSDMWVYIAKVIKDWTEVMCNGGYAEVTSDNLDKEWPTIDTGLLFTGYECSTITWEIDSGKLIDPGCSSGGEMTCSWTGWTYTTWSDMVTTIFEPVTFTDSLWNQSNYTGVFSFENVAITGHDFTVENVWRWKTVNWKDSDYWNVSAWECEDWEITATWDVDHITWNNQKWYCSIVWTGITYHPFQNQTWEDSCTFMVTDWDSDMVITGTFKGIDTQWPIVTLSWVDGVCTPITGHVIEILVDWISKYITGSLFMWENIKIPECNLLYWSYCAVSNPDNTIDWIYRLSVELLWWTWKIWLNTGIIQDELWNWNDYVEIVVWNYDGLPPEKPELLSEHNHENIAELGMNFKWSSVNDSGCAWLSWYILKYWSWSEDSNSYVEIITGATSISGTLEKWDYWWIVTAVDKFWKSVDSDTWYFSINSDDPVCHIEQISQCTTWNVVLKLSFSWDLNIEIFDDWGINWIWDNGVYTWEVLSWNWSYPVIIRDTDFDITWQCTWVVTWHDEDAPVINSITTWVYECTGLTVQVDAIDTGCAWISGYLFSGWLFNKGWQKLPQFNVGSLQVWRTWGVEITWTVFVKDSLENQTEFGINIQVLDIKPFVTTSRPIWVLTWDRTYPESEVIAWLDAKEWDCGSGDLYISWVVNGQCTFNSENKELKIEAEWTECVVEIADNEWSTVTWTIKYTTDTSNPAVELIGTNLACMSTNTFVVTWTFSENVFGFNSWDISITGWNIVNFGWEDNIYSWTVSMNPMEIVSIQLPAWIATNINWNSNQESNILTWMYDNAWPDVVTFSNWQDTWYSTEMTLSWDDVDDQWCAGLSGYNYKFVEGENCNVNVKTSGFKTDTSLAVNSLNDWNTYTLCVQPVDKFWNTWIETSESFVVDLNSIWCKINQAACTSGDLNVDLVPANLISMENISLSWTQWERENSTSLTKSVNDPDGTIYWHIRQQSGSVWKEWSCSTPVTNIDKIAPTITELSSVSVSECTSWTATISATDDGCGNWSIMYKWEWMNDFWDYITYSLYSGSVWSRTVNVQVKDSVWNVTSDTVVFTWTNTEISANNFTWSESVWSEAKTVNWRVLSDAMDWDCGSWSDNVIFSGFVSTWTKWVCTRDGDEITYTPNSWVEWSDYCEFELVDDEWSSAVVKAHWSWIDTEPPAITQSGVSVPECTTWTAIISTTESIMYKWEWMSDFWNNNSRSQYNGIAWDKVVKLRVKDSVWNITSTDVTFTWTNTLISKKDFTVDNVWSGAKTVNWKTSSEATDWACGNGTIYFSGVETQWSYWTCSVDGDNITYTPDSTKHFEWSDTCIIRIRDDEFTAVDVAIVWSWIDTRPPVLTVTNAQWYECEIITWAVTVVGENIDYKIWSRRNWWDGVWWRYLWIYSWVVNSTTVDVTVRDGVSNTTTTWVQFTWLDTGVTLNATTVHWPTLTASQTVQQWVFTLFGAREWNCGITNLSANVLSCTWWISSMTIDWNTKYTVTPVELYEWQWQCTIEFKDDDWKSAIGTIVFDVHTWKPSPYLTISVDKTLVNVDENVKYTVCYGNTWNATWINVNITVDLPSLFNWNVNWWTSNGGQYNSMFHSVSWTLPTLAPNQTWCFNYFVWKYSKEWFYVTVATLDWKNVTPALVSSATVEVVARPYCGDWIVWDNEVCDDWKNNGKKWYCNEDCDGYVERTDNDKQWVACKYSDENYLSRWVFTDTYGHWWFNYIENMRLSCLHRWKMTFAWLWQYRPDDSTTRAEVVKTLVKIRWIQKDDFDINTEDAIYPGAQLFVDVPRNHWFAWYSEYAYNNWLMDELYATVWWQRYFVPEWVISRNEIIKKVMILYNELNGVSSIDSKISWSSRLTDVASNSPYYKYIREAESLWIISWVDNLAWWNQWQWSRSLTRAEFAKIVSNAFSDILFED